MLQKIIIVPCHLNESTRNDGSNTYLHPATGSSSAIDLSIASPSLYLDFSWELVTDLHGSYHFPICIQSYNTAPLVANGTWKLAKVNWTDFYSKASSDLGINYPSDLEDPIEHFTNILTNIANSTNVLSLKANRDQKNVIPSGLTTNA